MSYKKTLFPFGRILMCCPENYEINYEINPWMKKEISPAKKNAWRQWKELHHTILRLGAWVEYVEQPKGQPDLVFTANAGLVKNNRCVLSSFRYKERKAEEPTFKKWFTDHGFEVFELKNATFEGAGDALFAGETLFAGRSYRTDIEAYQQVTSILNVKNIVDCELINPYFYHLDTCFCPLDADTAIYYPGAFSPASIAEMRKHIRLIEVCEEEARKFACNSVVLGKNVIIPAGCTDTADKLNKKGFTNHDVELSEFIKAGGASKCLTLSLAI